ncbi:phosphoribosyltransferase [Hydrogenothermus marinus]|uniref:Putative phosphoribosyltransferase n=1 Tax=Hydrogenothermus marinus TaxID=133270 RepID=A0A3M0BKF2_9AQUI|nr:phosphoribosyltransferase family protein [Hydrogenothermus marinus]RMA97711.1 putative phosphoribosyltransferase [Hydrogenothermus marinus]
MKLFKNREEAGNLIGKYLNKYLEDKEDAIILAIPRGGVPVAYYVAKETGIPFYFVISSKITSPSDPELALGAVDIEGNYVISDFARRIYNQEQLEIFKKMALEKNKEKAKKYGFKDIDLKDKIAIIVDDGVATGYTAIVSSLYAKKKGAKKVILAVPVCPSDAIYRLKDYFNDIICLERIDSPYFAVGMYYEDFHQVEDEEFFDYIEKAKKEKIFLEKE